ERRLAIFLVGIATFLTAIFYRDFSYVHFRLGPIPLFATELILVLVALLLLHEVMRTGKVVLRTSVSLILALLYIAWGMVCLYRGRSDGMVSVREFAVNYYAILYIVIVGYAVISRDASRLWWAIVCGSLIAYAIILARVVHGVATSTSTGALRYHAPVAVGAAASLFWFLGAPSTDRRRKLLLRMGAIASILVIVVATQHRSALIALLVALLAWAFFFERGRAQGSIGSKSSIAMLLGVGCLALLLTPQLMSSTIERARSISLNPEEVNARWRLFYWALLFARIHDQPIVGHGLGDNLPAFWFHGVKYGIDPDAPAGVHNSFLFVLYKEGIIGLGLLVVFLLWVLKSAM